MYYSYNLYVQVFVFFTSIPVNGKNKSLLKTIPYFAIKVLRALIMYVLQLTCPSHVLHQHVHKIRLQTPEWTNCLSLYPCRMCILTGKKTSISFKGKIESISCEYHEMPKEQHALNRINCGLSEISRNELLITLHLVGEVYFWKKFIRMLRIMIWIILTVWMFEYQNKCFKIMFLRAEHLFIWLHEVVTA